MNDDLLPENKEEENGNQKNLFLIQLKKHWAIAISVFLLPVLASYYWASTNTTYHTKMLVHVDTFSWRELNYFFRNLSSALEHNDYDGLSKTFFMKKDIADKIESLQLVRVKDQRESYVINLTTSDISAIKPVETAIEVYMHSNTYLQTMLAEKREVLARSLDSIRNDLKNLGALQELAHTNKIQAEMIPYYMSSINSSCMLLRDKEKNNLLELSKIKGFVIIEGFGIPAKQKNELLRKYLVFGLGMGALLCFILLSEITPRLNKKEAS